MKKSLMLITFVFIFILGSIFSPVLASNYSWTFNQNLKGGDSSPAVLILQQILNNNSATQIAVSGPGSKGNETNYFGTLTKLAVIKFQNLYATDILVPNGLSQGNGFVGQATRAKLNQLLSAQLVGTGSPSTVSTPILNSTIPNSSAVATSTASFYTNNATSSQNGSNPPKIISISPTLAGLDDSVIITGVNFSEKSNIIFSPFGSTTVSSDGTHLKFVPSSFSDLKSFTDRLASLPSGAFHSTNVPIYVVTDDGFTNNPVVLKIKF